MTTTPLLDEMLAAHGGSDRWQRVETVALELETHGLAFTMRGHRGLESPQVRVAAHRPEVSFADYPVRGETGRFTPDEVWIETPAGGVRASRTDPRAAFRRSPRRMVKWDELDLLYFCGYAIWNYVTAPFLFAGAGVRARQVDDHRLALDFAPTLPTHCARQTAHAGGDGLLTRLDYTADVIGPYAFAANRVLENREVGGLTFAVTRRVTPRGPRSSVLPGPLLVDIRIGEIDVA